MYPEMIFPGIFRGNMIALVSSTPTQPARRLSILNLMAACPFLKKEDRIIE